MTRNTPGPCLMGHSTSARVGKTPSIFSECKIFQLVQVKKTMCTYVLSKSPAHNFWDWDKIALTEFHSKCIFI